MSARACILGCAGEALGETERAFFRDVDPWGFTLFARNVSDKDRTYRLTQELRECVGRNALVFVDQEGGRVQRLKPPHWRAAPPAGAFGELFAHNPVKAAEAVRINHRLLAADLRSIGCDADCAPCLDLVFKDADPVIGDRAFSSDPAVVSALGRAAMDGLGEGGVTSVIKHLPGHGRADADSHHALPRVCASHDELASHDLKPFAALADAPMAMTAHVVYKAWDGERPATLSPVVIEKVIRGAIGFSGLLMTDDLSMKALGGAFAERAAAAFAAGCDVALHCNGDMKEMTAVAAASPPLEDAALERARRAETSRNAGGEADIPALAAQLDAMLAPVCGATAAS